MLGNRFRSLLSYSLQKSSPYSLLNPYTHIKLYTHSFSSFSRKFLVSSDFSKNFHEFYKYLKTEKLYSFQQTHLKVLPHSIYHKSFRDTSILYHTHFTTGQHQLILELSVVSFVWLIFVKIYVKAMIKFGIKN